MNFMGNGITRFSQMSKIRAIIHAQLLSEKYHTAYKISGRVVVQRRTNIIASHFVQQLCQKWHKYKGASCSLLFSKE